jgi:hypothetical protein
MSDPEPKDPSEASSEALVGMVVAFRALGICKEEARAAMIELMRRKENGDEFDFEAMIKQKFDELPKSMLDPETLNLMNSLATFGGFSK